MKIRNKTIMRRGKLDLWFIKNKKTLMKIAKVLMVLVIPLLLLAVGLIAQGLISGKIEGFIRKILTTLILIAMLYFVYILFLLLTKYNKKEFELNDKELKAKWKYLSEDYKRFWYEMSIFGLIFFSFITIFGLSEVFLYKNYNGWFQIIIGIVLFDGEVRRIRRLRSWGLTKERK